MNSLDPASPALGVPFLRTIEWEMMDKSKFFPLSMMSSFSVRCALYPLTVVKTRLQIQRHNEAYKGMMDACIQIRKSEGMRGLYKGFWVSAAQLISGVFYISTYEGVRHILKERELVSDSRIRGMVGGAAASLVGQSIVVPFDVISQHIMILGQAKGASHATNPLGVVVEGRTKFQIAAYVTAEIYRRDGLKGYYRGYTASLCTYVPNSAMWWLLYHFYQDELHRLLPSGCSHLMIQCISGTMGGFTTTLLTNPLDIVRARLQVQRIGSMSRTFRELWAEEGMRIFSKGLSARLVQSAVYSFAIILSYESIKRLSINDEYRDLVRW
ncbi:solute carrier family 25 member 44 isoform X2 [Neocloeon triangulifer]|uniref:solute carrier family 25 member 44 isoform X2 n=1 Tax=Neocloeon triangulifer TaxID=2078957 RepID=UPI00286F031C|nr:solute carrier family 25 member 44 isoform X2 [Neocloeon triangulifer]